MSGMSLDQVLKESGGKQFDDKGQPLVGRYRDGTTPKGDKKAYGVAQMQIGTARQAAAQAGIPWDQNKFMTDAAYNRSLGDAHMNYLRTKYNGDESMAQGAYHSGEGTVDRLVRTQGANWAAGLGPEGRNYVGKVGMASGAGGDYQIPDVLRDAGRTEGATAAPSQVFDPTQAGPTLKAQAATVRGRAQVADDVLTQAITSMQAVQGNETDLLAARNERVNTELETQAARTQEVIATVQPLFQQRRAVIDQKRKLTQMNPLERGIRSLFDQNYDNSHLDRVSQDIDEELAVTGEEYKTILGAQDNLLKIIDASYQGASMFNTLQSQHLMQNVELAGKSLLSADALMDSTMGSINADRTLRVAQLEIGTQVLEQLTPGQISANLAIAKKSPDGTVTVNGATLTEGQLLRAAKGEAETQMRLDQFVINMKSQNMALKDKSADDLISSLTTSKIRQAINNGGMFNGVQLPLDRLGVGLQNSMKRDELMASGTVQQGAEALMRSQMKGIAGATKIASMRAVQMTGGQPTELSAIMDKQSPEIWAIVNKINQAPPEQRDSLAQFYQPRIAQMAEERSKAIGKIAERWAGGNKDLMPLAQAFLTGTPLNAESSAKGLISLIKSGGQLGNNLSPEANAAINAARGVVRRYEAEDKAGGTSMNSLMNPQKKGEREASMLRDVTRAISGNYSNAQFNAVIQSAPQIARQINHQAMNLDGQTLRQALDMGDEEGYRRVGQQLGLNADEAKVMFGQPGGGKTWEAVKGKAGNMTFGQLQTRLATQQQVATFQFLDQNHPKLNFNGKSYTAGAVFANLLADPRFADTAGRMSQAQGQGSFGDFIVAGMGQGTQTALVSQYGQQARQSYNLLTQSGAMRRAAQVNAYSNDAWARTRTILGSIPDLQPAEEETLFKALKTMTPSTPGVSSTFTAGVAAPISGQDQAGQQFSLIQRTLTTKFQDPNLERIRQKAAKNFEQYAKITDDALDRLGAYSPEN